MMWWLTLLGCSAILNGSDGPNPRSGNDGTEQTPRKGKSGKRGGNADRAASKGADFLEITYRGVKRGAIVHVPKSVAKSGKKVPAIVMHHGGHGASSAQAAAMWEGQMEQDFILIFPDGQTVEPDKAGWMPVKGELDYGVRFVEQILDEAVKNYPIDNSKVFAVGWSNGAQQTMRLACLSSDRFQAFTVVNQTLELDTQEACQGTFTPRPMQFIIGDADPKNPWEGRGEKPGGSSPGRIGIQDTLDFFVDHNDCKANPKPNKLPDKASDGMKVVEKRYEGCKKGDVRWLLVEGGGHAWPGGKQGCKDIDGASESVAFFREHGL